MELTPSVTYSDEIRFRGVTDWYQEPRVMIASVILIYSDSSEESMGSSNSWVILFGTDPYICHVNSACYLNWEDKVFWSFVTFGPCHRDMDEDNEEEDEREIEEQRDCGERDVGEIFVKRREDEEDERRGSCLGYHYHRLLSLLRTLTFFPDVPCSASYSFWLGHGWPFVAQRYAIVGCGARAPCRCVCIVILAELREPLLGLMFIPWPELAARLTIYVIMSPQSSVSSVRADDITKLKSAWLLAANGIVCVPRMLLGSSIYIVTYVLTQRELDHHCSVFNIPTELRPELPDRNSTVKDSPKGKIGMYTRFIEFDNYRVPLSNFLLCVLEYYQIHLSQFCDWCGEAGTSVVKDPLPVDEAVDLPCVELLNENHTLIRKYPETFLCFVGLSRSFTDTDVRPTLLHDNDEEIGLLDFVKSVDPFKDELNVNSGKRKKRATFVSGSPLVKKAHNEGIVISETRPSTADKSSNALRRLIKQGEQVADGSGSAAAATVDITFSSVTHTPEHVLEDALHDNVFSLVSSSPDGVSVPATESASDGHPVSAPELETRILSATPSNGSSADDFYESQTVDFATAMNAHVPNWNVTNNGRVDDPVICRSLLDNVTPLGYWAALRNQSDVGFLNAFNINSSQHICMASELRLRYEHEIMTREKFERKFIDSVAVVQQRDTEVADLKVKLEKLETEAAEVEELRKLVSDLEAPVAVKSGEVASLTTQNAGLLERVSTAELECDSLKSQVVGEGKMREEFLAQQDEVERHFTDRDAKLDARIAYVRRDMDNDLYPHMLTAIAGRRWVVRHGFLLAVYKCARFVECRSALGKVISMAINKGMQQGLEVGNVHGKAGRSLAQVEACDPEVEGKYVAAVFEFEGVSFPLLDELESLKDSHLALIMSALTLKDDQAAGGNLLNRIPRDALTIIENKSKVRTSRNKPIVSKVSTTSSSPSPSPYLTALTEIVKELVLMNKATQQATVKAIEETYVTCGGPNPYYERLATGGNTFDACTAVGPYNQGGNRY
uniref:Transposase (Putative), gypsy type n=1 Tax=Tanacetum cinerariifolium TaxID=118510 RepID=A0A6L2L142_TANCI|nr:transposase (putative), gypsy type [Tanacetum cinerariifolium]